MDCFHPEGGSIKEFEGLMGGWGWEAQMVYQVVAFGVFSEAAST